MCFTVSFKEGNTVFNIYIYYIFSMYSIGSNLHCFFSGLFSRRYDGPFHPSLQPGGELAIITFAGKDATEEFNMLLKPAKCRSILCAPKNEFCKNANIRVMTWTNEILENRNTLPPLMWHSDSRNSAFKVCHN